MGKILGVTKQTIINNEKGNTELSWERLEDIAKAIKIDVDELFPCSEFGEKKVGRAFGTFGKWFSVCSYGRRRIAVTESFWLLKIPARSRIKNLYERETQSNIEIRKQQYYVWRGEDRAY